MVADEGGELGAAQAGEVAGEALLAVDVGGEIEDALLLGERGDGDGERAEFIGGEGLDGGAGGLAGEVGLGGGLVNEPDEVARIDGQGEVVVDADAVKGGGGDEVGGGAPDAGGVGVLAAVHDEDVEVLKAEAGIEAGALLADAGEALGVEDVLVVNVLALDDAEVSRLVEGEAASELVANDDVGEALERMKLHDQAARRARVEREDAGAGNVHRGDGEIAYAREV